MRILVFLLLLTPLACQRTNNPVAECRRVPDVHVLELTPGNASVEIEIRIKTGLGSTPPSFALWTETRQGNASTIYVTCKAAKGYEGNNMDNHQDLPVWNRVRTLQNLSPDSEELDAVTTATPTRNSFRIHWEPITPNPADTISIYLEVNIPYDYNNFYTRNMGTNGQPSLIYRTSFTLPADTLIITQNTRILGRGDHKGNTDQIYPDLTGVTTALDIIEGISLKRLAK